MNPARPTYGRIIHRIKGAHGDTRDAGLFSDRLRIIIEQDGHGTRPLGTLEASAPRRSQNAKFISRFESLRNTNLQIAIDSGYIHEHSGMCSNWNGCLKHLFNWSLAARTHMSSPSLIFNIYGKLRLFAIKMVQPLHTDFSLMPCIVTVQRALLFSAFAVGSTPPTVCT